MKLLKWVVLNSAVCASAWFGYVGGNHYFSNVFAFFSWLAFIFGVLSFFASKEIKKEIRKQGRSVPAVISETSDLFLVVFCAAFGHWFYATAWTVSMLSNAVIYGDDKK